MSRLRWWKLTAGNCANTICAISRSARVRSARVRTAVWDKLLRYDWTIDKCFKMSWQPKVPLNSDTTKRGVTSWSHIMSIREEILSRHKAVFSPQSSVHSLQSTVFSWQFSVGSCKSSAYMSAKNWLFKPGKLNSPDFQVAGRSWSVGIWQSAVFSRLCFALVYCCFANARSLCSPVVRFC